MSQLQLRPEVQRFAEAMERQLQANDHKGGWSDEELPWLFERLKQETDELLAVVKSADIVLRHGNLDDYRRFDFSELHREAADVANFAMMIANNAGL